MLKFFAWPSVAPISQKKICAEQRRLIVGTRITTFEQIKSLHHSWAAIALVFARRRDRQGLTAIFLRQAEQTAILCPSSSKRSINSAVVVPKVAMCALFAGRARALASLRQQYSFSTLKDPCRSAAPGSVS